MLGTLRLTNKMNTYVALTCLLAVVGLTHGSAIGIGSGVWGGLGYGGYGGLGYGGYGGLGWGSSIISVPYVAPAVSTANLVKAAPIPVVKTVVAPVISTGAYGLGGYGLGGYGYGGYGLGSLGWNSVGWNGVGWNGVGVGKGLWSGYGKGWGH